VTKFYYEQYSISTVWSNVLNPGETYESSRGVYTSYSQSNISGDEYVSGYADTFTYTAPTILYSTYGSYRDYKNYSFTGIGVGSSTMTNGQIVYQGTTTTMIQAEIVGNQYLSGKKYLDVRVLQRKKFNRTGFTTIYNKYQKGSYLSTIIAEDGSYPDNGISGSYWYIKTTKVFPEMQINVNGGWKEVDSGWVHINGTWREITSIWTNVLGTWRES
jgi:hypothetical protein